MVSVSVPMLAMKNLIFKFSTRVFFMQRFNMPAHAANFINSLVFIISAVASPLLGFMVDRVGRNAIWVILSVATTLGCHALLAFTYLNPYIAMVRNLLGKKCEKNLTIPGIN
jgi:MFS family permease